MRYVLDASVAVSGIRSNEAAYTASATRLERIRTGEDSIVVPALFRIEVVAAICRLGTPFAGRGVLTF